MQNEERKKPFILSVDADCVSQLRTSAILQQLDYNVFSVKSAEEAQLIMQVTVPKLVLTEITLPKMTGIDLIRQMKKDQSVRDVPVIIYTSVKDPTTRQLCMQAGCTGFLAQPAEPNHLYHAIQKVTEATPREYVRLTTLLDVIVGAKGIPGYAVTREKVTALSENGMYVYTLKPLHYGTVLPYTLFLKKDHAAGVTFEGKVIYSNDGKNSGKQPGMGVIFTRIRPEDKERIKDFILERLMEEMPITMRTP
jgi:two-component system alkaline phosphatase synthesis response regulator PhoP